MFAATDPFETAKRDFAKAGCVNLEFLTILESDVFDVVDSVRGTAEIARDGRFHVVVGTEEFLYDGNLLYTFSETTNQVIIEKPAGDLFVGSEIALITRLDDFYATAPLRAGKEYHLTKTDTTDTQLPDEITVTLRAEGGRIDALAYDDLNGDRNRVVFLKERLGDACTDSTFVPAFPESAERIKL